MRVRWLLAAFPLLMLACREKEPAAADFFGRWTARADAPGLLKGRLSAASYALRLHADGTASFENVPTNLYGTPPGPLVSGTGTWCLTKNSGRTVLTGMVTSGNRSIGLEFEILPTEGAPAFYVDLTDPDQMERFVYVKEASGR